MYCTAGLLIVLRGQYTRKLTMVKGRQMRTSLLAVLAIAVVLAFGGTALAQDSPTQDAYGGVLGNEVENSADTQATIREVGGDSGGGSLPFTGFEVGLVALAGIGLVGLGFAMRRSTRRNDT
jgi:hypothetical protein